MSSRREKGRKSLSEGLDRLIVAPARPFGLRGAVVAVAGPVLVTGFAALIPHRSAAVPALLYLLTVVAAGAVGHLWPALLAAGLSFVGLDYFFTPPVHTFAVDKAEDLLVLAIFLLVAAAVSAALSAALEQRARAEAREHQVRALYNVTSRLLSGAGLDAVLVDLAGSLRRLYGLKGCRIVVLDREGRERERASSGSGDDEMVTTVPLVADGSPVGRIELLGTPVSGIGGTEEAVMDTFAGQLALAIERARLGQEAASARLEADASRTRAALFSSVTHDLRTPLASITASASSLLDEGVPFSGEQRHELLRTILEESERLNRLVGNLMDLSRLRSGALVPSRDAIPVDELISSVIGRLRSQLQGRSVRVQIREDIPPVPMDALQMDQVLTNLLENAVRFSPPGSEISITALRWQNQLEVKVADRGPGIPAADRTRVFDEFYRKDVGEWRGGTGLGLAIAKAIVTAHGGSMRIEATPGGGTTVGFRLPLTPIGDGAAVDTEVPP
jgi:two-component system, OmpR family, sensor histidine kinase KdpD